MGHRLGDERRQDDPEWQAECCADQRGNDALVAHHSPGLPAGHADRSEHAQGSFLDAIFRACPVVVLPDYSRPLIRVSDYRKLIESSTYCGDRVRP